MRKRSKYNNTKVTTFNRKYDSKGERDRALFLMDAQKNGEIKDLRQQVPYNLSVNSVHVCKYVADFVYQKKDFLGRWVEVVEDFKGFQTDVFKLKRKLLKACHGVDIHISKTPTEKI